MGTCIGFMRPGGPVRSDLTDRRRTSPAGPECRAPVEGGSGVATSLGGGTGWSGEAPGAPGPTIGCGSDGGDLALTKLSVVDVDDIEVVDCGDSTSRLWRERLQGRSDPELTASASRPDAAREPRPEGPEDEAARSVSKTKGTFWLVELWPETLWPDASLKASPSNRKTCFPELAVLRPSQLSRML